MRLSLSPVAYRRIALAALLALGFIVVTGGAVRLTGSGLGCSDWPSCEPDQLTAQLEDTPAMIEFVNRTVTGLVSVAVIVAVLGSRFRRPARRDLTWWSVGLVAGVAGQVVLGGLTVLFELKPQFVMAHFLLSMVLVWNAVVLHHRAGEGIGEPTPVVPDLTRWLARAAVALAGVVIVVGTVLTASGPHGGDEAAKRLDLVIEDVARVHGTLALTLLAVAAALLWTVRSGPRAVRSRALVLTIVIVAQAAIGYVQYLNDIPELLVGIHIAGAVTLWAAALETLLATRTRPDEAPVAPAAAPLPRTQEEALVTA